MPEFSKTVFSTAVRLFEGGRIDEAEAVCRQLLKGDRYNPDVTHLLAWVAEQRGDREGALILVDKAIGIRSSDPAFWNTKAMLLTDLGRPAEAVEAARRSVALKPGIAASHNTLGTAFQRLGRVAEATEAFRTAVQLDPKLIDARQNLSWALLVSGDYEAGWTEFEYRASAAWVRTKQASAAAPLWAGEDLGGRALLVHREQGFGDTIQFARYLPLARARGCRVTFSCQSPLVDLIARIDPTINVVPEEDRLPPADRHIGLMSLPRLFGVRANETLVSSPYVSADPVRRTKWAERLAAEDGVPRLRVGVVWAGSAANPEDRHRSLGLSTLAPLASVAGVRLYSLQKGEAAERGRQQLVQLGVMDYTDDLVDFLDTAGLVANLDLVIAADTAVAHLTGALGKPVWVLVPFVPDWRWMLEREDSPWYPTMRLFRQGDDRAWGPVVARVAGALKGRAEHV
jgi:Flp pilus assembly protein TadD